MNRAVVAAAILIFLSSIAVRGMALAQASVASVVRVIDGDTVDVRDQNGKVERIRIIGLDTPETVDPRKAVQCFGREASDRAKQLFGPGQAVILESDNTQDGRDKYGRLLAHIMIQNGDGTATNFSEEMIANGFGHHYVYRTPSKYAEVYWKALAHAQEQELGLWSADTCVGVAYPKHDLEDGGAVPGSVALIPVEDEPVELDVSRYLGRTEQLSCSDFASQAQAQAVFDADRTDPNRLDGDRDRVACKGLLVANRSRQARPTPTAVVPSATTLATSVPTRPATPRPVISEPSPDPEVDPGVGSLGHTDAAPVQGIRTPTAQMTRVQEIDRPEAMTNPSKPLSRDIFNCADYRSQAEAQMVLRADPSDPNRLDPDRNGVACKGNRAPRDEVPVPR